MFAEYRQMHKNYWDKLKTVGRNGRILTAFIAGALIALLLELTVFNITAIRDMGNTPMVIGSDISIGEDGSYSTDTVIIDDYVKNVYIEDVYYRDTDSFIMQVTLTDEGDEYEYSLPYERVAKGVSGSGYINIYPYGRVHSIRVVVTVPEGTDISGGRISVNAKKPYDIKWIRLVAVTLFISITAYSALYGWSIYIRRGDKRQIALAVAVCAMLILLGRWLSISNELMVACPWPHHKQYQELAEALDNGRVSLNEQADQRLLEKDNPYDTNALTAEEIPYNMDYAYYNGKYYVYFGIVPELLLYYPYYKITGHHLTNYNADFIMYAILVTGVFVCMWELMIRYGYREKEKKNGVPYLYYILISVCICLFSNMVYLIARPDIYNIPIISAAAFGFWGIGLVAAAGNSKGNLRKAFLCLAALSLSLIAGCRPQMMVIWFMAGYMLLLEGDVLSADGKPTLKRRLIFTRETIADTIIFCIPCIAVAIVVCLYNYARFGNILDFGATYSLTTNDMNHRGFNINRLLRGMYCFLLQPSVRVTDFPFIASSVIDSAYMGKNPTEYTYGGYFATNALLLGMLGPFLIGKDRGKSVRYAVALLLLLALVVVGFDVNGAGILYRYTCDAAPLLLLGTALSWLLIFKEYGQVRKLQVIFVIAFFAGLFYSMCVFMGGEGSVNLMDNSPVLYESVRHLFMI